MRKNTLTAGIIAGLLFVISGASLAGPGPYGITDGGQVLPRIARGIEKTDPGTIDEVTGPTTAVQAGVTRTGAVYCDGIWQGDAASYYNNLYVGDEFYAVYQDPEEEGSCAGFVDVYPFDVTAVKWYVFAMLAGQSYDMQPLIYATDDDFGCLIPGEVLCAGPLYTMDLPTVGAYLLTLPLPDQCCVYRKYFAGVYSGPFVGTGYLGLVVDNDVTVPPAECRSYNDFNGQWNDLVADIGITRNLELWSAGNAFDQNTCPGEPADFCERLSAAGPGSVFWTEPGPDNATDRYVMFNSPYGPDVACSLMSADITLYGAQTAGTPTMRVRVYGGNGPIIDGEFHPAFDSNPPGTDPNLIVEIDVPYQDFQFFPAVTTVDFTAHPSWPSGFVSYGDAFYITVSLSPNTPQPGTDVLSVLSDDASGSPDRRSGAYYQDVSKYLSNYAAFNADYDWLITANVCYKILDPQPPNCPHDTPDDWNTWAHDYGRTCRTEIPVGDPCAVNPVWTQPLTGALNSFCEPTIADGRVYVSVDDRLYSFDLDTGTPGNTVAGLPYIFSNNRGNMTIDGGWVYVSGGNGQSFSHWDPTLSFGWPMGPWTPVGGGPLGGSCRFGVSVVYDIGGTEVVVVGTEGSPGRLWCFETSTGVAYSGWATNPVLLPQGIWHSPSYDGTDLFVGTANSSNVAGQIHSIDAATGTINWTYTPSDPTEGFPGGVSVDGDYVYAAGSKSDFTGNRVKLDKATGAVQWEFPQSRALYGVPAIGRNFLYINQDVGGAGVLVVDKNSGAALYNFAANGVGPVSQHVTVTCDKYLFAGDRNGRWWLLDANNFEPVWSVPFNGIVNGTALADDPSGGSYAVVSIRSGNSTDGGGYVAAYELNSGARPHIVQNTGSVDIQVPPGTGPGNSYALTDVLENTGCADLHITSHNIYDPAPDVASKSFRDSQTRYAAALANLTVGNDYTAYFDESSKRATIAKRSMELVDGELTRSDVAIENAARAMADSKRSGQQLAAASGVVRTSGVSYFATIPSGGATDVGWVYDATGLSRGIDVEEIEFVTDDPDRVLFGNQPRLTIRYIGGCLPDITSIVWNTMGAANEEKFTNTGRLGDSNYPTNLIWGSDPNGAANEQLYDGSFLLAGPVPPDGDDAQFYIGDIYGSYPRLLLPDGRPSDETCEFDGASDVHMGWRRTGGCPGTPEEILGAWVRSYFVDSNAALAGTPYAAIGLNITQTEVGAYDPLFGDFSLIKWDLTERFGDTEDSVFAGTWTDWDVHPDYQDNHGIVSDVFNGYALWDWVTPVIAYGFLDPRMPTDYCGVDPLPFSPHRIQEMGTNCPAIGSPECGGYGLWQDEGETDYSLLWETVVNDPPRESGPHENDPVLWSEDHFGLLVNKPVSIGPYETKSVVQAKFAVPVDDVGSEGATDVATVEARCAELARRAAIWSGYARGDVNMDGCVNLIDVCWLSAVLTGGLSQIYPDFYNGDVNLSGDLDANDAEYLLNYVTGIGPAPMGEWRFEF